MRVDSKWDNPRDAIRPRGPRRDTIRAEDLIAIGQWLFALALISAALVASMVAIVMLLAE